MATGAEVLPPWKQEDYMSEAAFSSSVTQLSQERWEQQVSRSGTPTS